MCDRIKADKKSLSLKQKTGGIIMKIINKKHLIRLYARNGDTQCHQCGAWCQGIKAFDGHIYCSDCYHKFFE